MQERELADWKVESFDLNKKEIESLSEEKIKGIKMHIKGNNSSIS